MPDINTVVVTPSVSVVAVGSAVPGSFDTAARLGLGWQDVTDPLYGADPTGTSDSSTAIQAAITTAGTNGVIYFPPGTYLCHGLTGSASFQKFYGFGNVILKKNANGAILTHSGDDVEFHGVGFRGDASSPVYTGDNLVLTGDNPKLINSGSRWAYGRALKATGAHVQVLGTCDIWQTTDSSATGYDLEIGVSGTATLYHEISGYRSSQNTGGIKLIDTGSVSIVGGQFGKLTIASGTSPSGVNGGKTLGARILGPVTVELSSALLLGNQLGSSATVTFAVGTSQCIFSGNASSATITNNGNANNLIIREVSSGSTTQLKVGDDSSVAIYTLTAASGLVALPGHADFSNTFGPRLKNAAGTVSGSLVKNASDNVILSNTTSAKAIQISQTGAGLVQMVVNSAVQAYASVAGWLATRFWGAGTTHVAGDYVLSAEWGSTASVSSVSALDTGGRVVFSSSGSGITANPTVTLTWKDGTWTSVPVVVADRGDTRATAGRWGVAATATTCVFTFVGTPVSGETYTLDFITMGK